MKFLSALFEVAVSFAIFTLGVWLAIQLIVFVGG